MSDDVGGEGGTTRTLHPSFEQAATLLKKDDVGPVIIIRHIFVKSQDCTCFAAKSE